VIRDTDLKPLSHWLDYDLSPATVGSLVAHPAFAQAARALNRVKVEAAADPVMAKLSRDAGHYVAAALAFSLHRSTGITLPNLTAACVETRLMSAGRARALLGYLRHTGFLSPVSSRQGRSAAVYAPTPRFVEVWCSRMRRGLEAAVPLEPAVRGLLDRMKDPAVDMAYAQSRGDSILAGLARATSHDLPFVRIFNHRLGGGRALALLLSRDAGDGPLAAAPVPWALEDIARNCGISRVQTRRLFDDALAEGLVRIEGDQLTWQEEARRFIMYSAAFEFAAMLVSAAQTAAAL
jgi:AraC-like DNA-binding protein